MSTIESYRAKAAECGKAAENSNSPDQTRAFLQREQRFIRLADNEQWVADNYDKTLHPPARPGGIAPAEKEEENILRCLGKALITRWSTLPTKLQRELFDSAGEMSGSSDPGSLRALMARFLHTHKNVD